MSQILDPIPNNEKDTIVCCYVNATSQIQVARITNITNWYFERVVFPGQRLMFEAMRDALLEIHTGMMASAILSDTIPCERLCVDNKQNSSLATSTQTESKTEESSSTSDREIDNQSTINQLQTAIIVG